MARWDRRWGGVGVDMAAVLERLKEHSAHGPPAHPTAVDDKAQAA